MSAPCTKVQRRVAFRFVDTRGGALGEFAPVGAGAGGWPLIERRASLAPTINKGVVMDSARKTKIAVALVGGLSIWTAQAHAEFYVGGEVGSATIKSDDEFNGEDIDFDESDGAYRVYGGYIFLPILRGEVWLFHFGRPENGFFFC